jgi:hypothetical protein
MDATCECGNETSVSIKCWENIECLHKLYTTGGLSSWGQFHSVGELQCEVLRHVERAQ